MVSDTRYVKKSRKRKHCDWCWEFIEIGEPKHTWFCYDEAVQVNMHPECSAASLKADIEYELPIPGTFRRGCHCGENEEHCTCNNND